MLDCVDAGAALTQIAGDERTHRRVGTGLLQRLDLVCLDDAVGSSADADPVNRGSAMPHGHTRFAAGLDPANRPAELASGPHTNDVFGVAAPAALCAETAADVRGDGAHCAGLEAEQVLDRVLRAGRPLGTDPRSTAAVGTPRRRAGQRLDRRGQQARVAQIELDNLVALFPHRGFEGRRLLPLPRDIGLCVLVDERRAGQTLAGIDDGCERVVVDHDQLGGVDGVGPGLGEHDRNRFSDESNNPHSQQGTPHVAVHHRKTRREWPGIDVLAHVHGDYAVGPLRLGGVD